MYGHTLVVANDALHHDTAALMEKMIQGGLILPTSPPLTLLSCWPKVLRLLQTIVLGPESRPSSLPKAFVRITWAIAI